MPTRRSTRTVAVDGSETYPQGHERAGEPVVAKGRAMPTNPLVQEAAAAIPGLNAGDLVVLPTVARKRAELMGWGRDRELTLAEARELAMRGPAAKFAVAEAHGPGDVPGHGETTGRAKVEGSALPVIAASRQIQRDPKAWSLLVESGLVVEPPYDPWELVCTVEESDTLPQAVEAMATNVGGFGYDLEPLFAVEDPETGEALDPPEEAKTEREELELFLASCNIELGFAGLHELADRDIETIGWGAWEVLRGEGGDFAGFEHVPGYTLRLGPLSKPLLVEIPFRHPTTGELVTIRRYRRFRLYVQQSEGRIVWFKALGDPRHVNWRTGKAQAEPWPDEQGNSMEATELIYRRQYAPHTPYGVPRWIGAAPHVRAGRESAELVVDWFLNAPIGLKLAMIAGGAWKADSLAQALNKIDHGARGSDNAWSLVSLEGETDSGVDPMAEDGRPAPPRVAVEDLTYEIPPTLYSGDGNLIDESARRVRIMFRLPAIYFGHSEAETNRAAADVARAVAEEQVFRPLRALRWETLWNHEILPAMGVNHWRLVLRGAVTGDNEAVFKGLGPFNEGGGTTPNQLNRILAETTGTTAKVITEPWGDRPIVITTALLSKGIDPNLPLAEAIGQIQAKEQQQREQQQARMEALRGQRPARGPGRPPRPAQGGRPADRRQGGPRCPPGGRACRAAGRPDRLCGG